MKKLLFFLTLVFIIPVKAQDYLDKTAARACNCVSKIDMKGLSVSDRQAKVGKCVLTELSRDKAELEKFKAHNDFGDADDLGMEIGLRMADTCPDILLALVEDTIIVDPAFEKTVAVVEDTVEVKEIPVIKEVEESDKVEVNPAVDIADTEEIIIENIKEIPAAAEMQKVSAVKVAKTEKANENLLTEYGVITNIKGNPFNILDLETEDGSVIKFLWLTEFKGDHLLINNIVQKQEVKVQYSTMELYDAKRKAYINYRILTGLELLQ